MVLRINSYMYYYVVAKGEEVTLGFYYFEFTARSERHRSHNKTHQPEDRKQGIVGL